MYLLRFRTIQATVIRTLFEGLKDPLPDTNIEFTEHGMKIMSMDESHTVLIRVDLKAEGFDEYFCENKQVLGISIPNLCKMLKSFSQSDIMTWWVLRSDPNILNIGLENSEKSKRTVDTFNLLEIDETEIIVPDQDYPFILSLPSSEFQATCREMKNVSTKKIEIKHLKDKLIFSAKGEFGSRETTYNVNGQNNFQIIKSRDDEIYQGVFNLEKLCELTKLTHLGGSSTCQEIALNNHHPLVMRFPVTTLGEIVVCLAPMVSEDP